jgi:acyl-CoA reductase-like NAD-dependent aldehyde dehydrogenase
MMSTIYLLLAGNTVVLKPSEKSHIIAPLIADLFNEAGIPADVAGVMFGGPQAGKWLVSEPSVRKIFLYGRRQTGKEVASMCRDLEKPYVLEMSGGTAAIVCDDADIDVAARGISWSGCYANGESCINANRVIAEKSIAEPFLRKMKAYLEDIDTVNIGWKEPDHVRELIADALTKGARLIHGDVNVADSAANHRLQPILIADVTPSMRVWSEEALGPFIAARVVENAESALGDLRGDMRPLALSIWSKNMNRARSMAYSLPVAIAWINEISIGLPCLPWGGRGPTGHGSIFSEFALHEAADMQTLSITPNAFNRLRMWWYPYTQWKEKLLRYVAKTFY